MSQHGTPAWDLTLLNHARISGGTLPNWPLSCAKTAVDKTGANKTDVNMTGVKTSSAAKVIRQRIKLSTTLEQRRLLFRRCCSGVAHLIAQRRNFTIVPCMIPMPARHQTNAPPAMPLSRHGGGANPSVSTPRLDPPSAGRIVFAGPALF
jgi:hypothetical protein